MERPVPMHNDPSHQNFRLAVISDIHGNLLAFDAVMRALKSYDRIDRILVAGDVVGGPHDDHILRQLQEMKNEKLIYLGVLR